MGFVRSNWDVYLAFQDRFVHARKLLRTNVTLADAIASVRSGLVARHEPVLDTIERGIFGFSRSPFRPLLEAAGYDWPRVKTLIAAQGIEETLRHLSRDGVFVSIEEFKGLQEARRGRHVFRFQADDFVNPLVQSGLHASSGGTRSKGIPTMIPIENHLMGARHLAIALAAYSLEDAPIVLWMSIDHGATDWAVLALAAMGKTPSHWFTQRRGGPAGLFQLPYRLLIKAWGAMLGLRLPQPTYAPFGDEARVLRAIAGYQRACGVFTTASSALRLAIQAKQTGIGLDHVTFLTIGEPLTPAKLQSIQASGARAFSSLGFTEFGRATYGCASPASPDDTHICKDAVAVIQRRRTADRLGGEVDALLFTTLRPDARRILLNVETGDYARLTSRRCGCLLETIGWTEHLEGIRSFEKLTAEGRGFLGTEVIALVEEVLPGRFGGDPTDYQLVEQEDGDGFTRLSVLVHPGLGAVDEAAILHCVERALMSMNDRRGVPVWKAAETLRVRREAPLMTKAGKLMPLHHLGAQPAPAAREQRTA